MHTDLLIFFLHPLIDPHFTKMFLCWLRPLAEKQCHSVERLEGEEKNKVINMFPKCVCLEKSLMGEFSEFVQEKKITYNIYNLHKFYNSDGTNPKNPNFSKIKLFEPWISILKPSSNSHLIM